MKTLDKLVAHLPKAGKALEILSQAKRHASHSCLELRLEGSAGKCSGCIGGHCRTLDYRPDSLESSPARLGRHSRSTARCARIFVRFTLARSQEIAQPFMDFSQKAIAKPRIAHTEKPKTSWDFCLFAWITLVVRGQFKIMYYKPRMPF